MVTNAQLPALVVKEKVIFFFQLPIVSHSFLSLRSGSLAILIYWHSQHLTCSYYCLYLYRRVIFDDLRVQFWRGKLLVSFHMLNFLGQLRYPSSVNSSNFCYTPFDCSCSVKLMGLLLLPLDSILAYHTIIVSSMLLVSINTPEWSEATCYESFLSHKTRWSGFKLTPPGLKPLKRTWRCCHVFHCRSTRGELGEIVVKTVLLVSSFEPDQ